MTALQKIFVDFQNSAMPMELTALAASVALARMCAWALGRGATSGIHAGLQNYFGEVSRLCWRRWFPKGLSSN